MPLTTAGQFGPEALIDSRTGDPLPTGTTVTVPAGYTATFSGGNVTVTGPPADGVVVTITPPGGTAQTVTVTVPPAASELADVADLARAALPTATATATYRAVVNAAGHGVSPSNPDNTQALKDANAVAVTFGLPLVLPAGDLTVLSTPFTARNGLHIIGQGMGRTRVVMSGNGGGTGAPFYFVGPSAATGAAPDRDLSFADFTVDATAVTQTTSKPFYAQYLNGVRFNRVRCVGAPFTGFGMDYMVDAVYAQCVADDCGRLATIGDAGASGFGIGTGQYATEDVALIGCVGRGNKNYGVFFEQQNVANGGAPFLSTGPRVVGCYFASNGYGIGDSGVRGLVATGNIIEKNVRDGVIVDQGTGGGIGVPGVAGVVSGNTIRANGRHGVFLDYRFKAVGSQDSGYVVRGNQITDNATAGVQGSVDTFDVRDITVEDNQVSRNGANGVQFTVLSTGSWIDLSLSRNRVRSNGQTNTGGFTQGIRIDGKTTRLRIRENACYDSGATQKQTFGLKVSAASHTDTFIVGNDLRGNLTGGLDLTGPTTFSGLPVLRNNRGHNPRGASITQPTVPASGIAYTNVTGYDCTVFVAGGTVSAISLGAGAGTATGVTSGPVRVPAGQSITLTYTAAPTWTWFAD
jgi:hypothetical protein